MPQRLPEDFERVLRRIVTDNGTATIYQWVHHYSLSCGDTFKDNGLKSCRGFCHGFAEQGTHIELHDWFPELRGKAYVTRIYTRSNGYGDDATRRFEWESDGAVEEVDCAIH